MARKYQKNPNKFYVYPVCAECGQLMKYDQSKYVGALEICEKCYPAFKRAIEIRDRRMAEYKAYKNGDVL